MWESARKPRPRQLLCNDRSSSNSRGNDHVIRTTSTFPILSWLSLERDCYSNKKLFGSQLTVAGNVRWNQLLGNRGENEEIGLGLNKSKLQNLLLIFFTLPKNHPKATSHWFLLVSRQFVLDICLLRTLITIAPYSSFITFLEMPACHVQIRASS